MTRPSRSVEATGIAGLLVAALAVAGMLWLQTPDDCATCPASDSEKPGLQCGHWCLLRASWLLGAPVEKSEILEIMPPRSDGHSISELVEAFGKVGLEAHASEESFESLVDGPFPAVVHLRDPDHYVLVSSPVKLGILVFDGRGARRHVAAKTLRERMTGHVVRVQKSKDNPILPAYRNRLVDGHPCVQFDTLHIDKGDIALDDVEVQYTYGLHNRGTEPLIVKDVKTDCGCMSAKFPTDPIPANSQAEIVVKYRVASAKRASFSHTTVVVSNDPSLPVMGLHASGNSDARIRVSPNVVDFGRVVLGGKKDSKVYVYYSGDEFESFRITGCQCTLPNVTCRIVPQTEPDALEQETSDRLSVLELTASGALHDLPSTSVQYGTLNFQTNVDGLESVPVPVQLSIRERILAIPSVLSFGRISGATEEDVSTTVEIRGENGESISVNQVKIQGSNEVLAFTVKHLDDSIALTVQASASLVQKYHESMTEIDLRINDEDKFTLPLRMYGWSD